MKEGSEATVMTSDEPILHPDLEEERMASRREEGTLMEEDEVGTEEKLQEEGQEQRPTDPELESKGSTSSLLEKELEKELLQRTEVGVAEKRVERVTVENENDTASAKGSNGLKQSEEQRVVETDEKVVIAEEGVEIASAKGFEEAQIEKEEHSAIETDNEGKIVVEEDDCSDCKYVTGSDGSCSPFTDPETDLESTSTSTQPNTKSRLEMWFDDETMVGSNEGLKEETKEVLEQIEELTYISPVTAFGISDGFLPGLEEGSDIAASVSGTTSQTREASSTLSDPPTLKETSESSEPSELGNKKVASEEAFASEEEDSSAPVVKKKRFVKKRALRLEESSDSEVETEEKTMSIDEVHQVASTSGSTTSLANDQGTLKVLTSFIQGVKMLLWRHNENKALSTRASPVKKKRWDKGKTMHVEERFSNVSEEIESSEVEKEETEINPECVEGEVLETEEVGRTIEKEEDSSGSDKSQYCLAEPNQKSETVASVCSTTPPTPSSTLNESTVEKSSAVLSALKQKFDIGTNQNQEVAGILLESSSMNVLEDCEEEVETEEKTMSIGEVHQVASTSGCTTSLANYQGTLKVLPSFTQSVKMLLWRHNENIKALSASSQVKKKRWDKGKTMHVEEMFANVSEEIESSEVKKEETEMNPECVEGEVLETEEVGRTIEKEEDSSGSDKSQYCLAEPDQKSETVASVCSTTPPTPSSTLNESTVEKSSAVLSALKQKFDIGTNQNQEVAGILVESSSMNVLEDCEEEVETEEKTMSIGEVHQVASTSGCTTSLANYQGTLKVLPSFTQSVKMLLWRHNENIKALSASSQAEKKRWDKGKTMHVEERFANVSEEIESSEVKKEETEMNPECVEGEVLETEEVGRTIEKEEDSSGSDKSQYYLAEPDQKSEIVASMCSTTPPTPSSTLNESTVETISSVLSELKQKIDKWTKQKEEAAGIWVESSSINVSEDCEAEERRKQKVCEMKKRLEEVIIEVERRSAAAQNGTNPEIAGEKERLVF
ncbi:hypothetical protein WMY93_002784 [Mugilogobius chulae]|uniref:Uncharacterized protein n=1 Tax=Mugilogobius chulae TaxID=88201 RepID=A0AAW0PUX6_9GOBI